MRQCFGRCGSAFASTAAAAPIATAASAASAPASSAPLAAFAAALALAARAAARHSAWTARAHRRHSSTAALAPPLTTRAMSAGANGSTFTPASPITAHLRISRFRLSGRGSTTVTGIEFKFAISNASAPCPPATSITPEPARSASSPYSSIMKRRSAPARSKLRSRLRVAYLDTGTVARSERSRSRRALSSSTADLSSSFHPLRCRSPLTKLCHASSSASIAAEATRLHVASRLCAAATRAASARKRCVSASRRGEAHWLSEVWVRRHARSQAARS
eukprot:6201094-Pleurochrysis_carterae.AAC.3